MILHKAYKTAISPIIKLVFGGGCRYYPTCSEYSKEAFGRYGIVKGFYYSMVRLLSCNPFSKKDYFDPIK